MKIFSRDQIREADEFTIKHEPIASIDLMERAASACVKWIKGRYDASVEFKLICGLGNNGADGLAIARLLSEDNYKVKVFVLRYSEKESECFKINFQKLNTKKIDVQNIHSFSQDSIDFAGEGRGEAVIIDAILGSGLNKPAEGLIAECINFINQQPLPVIAIDLPSGLYCDKLNDSKDTIVKASFTLTFQFPKLSFMFPETAECIGEFSVLDIGLHQDYINHTQTKNYFITKNDVRTFFKTRSRTAHKGNFGHALIAAGSYGKIGAAVLASKACMHSGAGLLTSHVPKCGYEIMQTSFPEAMVDADSEENFITDNIRLEKYNAIGAGPGIGSEKQTQNVVKLLIQNTVVPLVLDADALNILSENKTWLSFIRAGSVFTPHPKEFERLAGKAENSEERLKMQRDFSIKYSVYVVLKGAHTSVSFPDGDVYFNSTGNPGMATGGSGDVLTGIITSLIAQGYSSDQACVLGVYLHGLAGDFAAYHKSEEAMTASDIIEHLPEAFKFLKE